jgi:hypothetical protein
VDRGSAQSTGAAARGQPDRPLMQADLHGRERRVRAPALTPNSRAAAQGCSR